MQVPTQEESHGASLCRTLLNNPSLPSLLPAAGNVDGKFSVGYRDAVVRTVVGLDRETTAAYTLVLEAIGEC